MVLLSQKGSGEGSAESGTGWRMGEEGRDGGRGTVRASAEGAIVTGSGAANDGEDGRSDTVAFSAFVLTEISGGGMGKSDSISASSGSNSQPLFACSWSGWVGRRGSSVSMITSSEAVGSTIAGMTALVMPSSISGESRGESESPPSVESSLAKDEDGYLGISFVWRSSEDALSCDCFRFRLDRKELADSVSELGDTCKTGTAR